MTKAAGAGPASVRKGGARRTPVRKWMHDSLREADLARQCLDIAGVILLAIDADGNVSMINKKGCETLGWPEEEIIGRKWIDSFLPEGLRSEVRVVFDRLMAGEIEPVEHFENTVLTRSGEERIIAWHNTVLRDDTGNITGALSSGEDVTALRSTSEALRRSEEHFRALVENSLDAIVVLNGDGTIRYESPSMERMLGCEAGDRIGRVGLDFVHPDDMAAAAQAFAELIANPGSTVQVEARGLHKDGSWRTLEIVGSNLAENPAVAGIVINMRDVTERKQAEKALRESQLEYELLVGSLADAVFRYRDGAIVWGNDRIREMLGYDEGEVIGEDVNLFVPDDVDLEELMKKVLVSLKEEGHFRGETMARGKDGSRVDIEYTASQVPGKDTFELVGTARDITERKRVAELVRESEEKYRELINTSADGVISVDAGMKVVLWNQGAERIFGYSEEEILGQSLYKIIPQRYRKAKRKAVRRYAGTGTGPLLGNVTEIEGLRKDGAEVPVELSMSSRKVGDTYVATAIVRDITVRRQVDEELRAQTQALGERVKEQTCLYGVSAKAGEPGISPEEVFERTLELIPAGWQYPEITCARVMFAGQGLTTDNFAETSWMQKSDIVTHGERTGSVEVYYREERPELDEGPFLKEERNLLDTIARLLARIVERNQTEKALEESEGKLRQIFESVNDEIVIVDSCGVILDVNERVRDIFGYAPDELIGRSTLDLDMYDQDEVEKIAEMLSESAREGSPVSRLYGMHLKHKDGHRVPVEVSSSVISGADGSTAGFVSVIRDITERKKAEEERERLSAEVAEKNKELEHIVYVSSHDMRSPLVNVQGFSKELNYSLQELVSILQHEEISQEVREKLSPIIETDIADSLTYIQASVLKMDSLLSGLLRLSRLGRAALNVETINLDEMVSEVMKANEYRIKSARVTVEIGDLPPCLGDSMQINQVFSNLVDNALKYLDPGRPGAIRVTGSVNEDSSVYCVADNGVGIAEKDLEQVFEIFRQINPGASTGDGIGLAVVKKIIGRSNGRIWVESEPGVGSKFFVSLPSANGHEPEGEEQ